LKKTKPDISALLLLAIALLLAGGIAAAIVMLRADPVEEALSVDRVINTLFVIEKDERPLGSYVLMYYPATRRAAVFDIPGDLGLIINRLKTVDRIDKVYNSPRITEFTEEIERLLGIDISFSVVIGADNLGRLVDLLEGVELFIPARINTMDGEQPVQFSSGLCRLDGDRATLYFSYNDPDESREAAITRRQRFFMAFLKQLGNMNAALQNPDIARVFHAYLNTSMSPRTRMLLFDELSRIDIERTGIQAVGGNLREVSDQMLLLPYYNGSLIKDIVRQTLGSLTRRTEGALSERVFTVEILNGTAVNGLAGRTAELLSDSFGYDVISTGNADSNRYEKTIIYDRSGYEEAAQIFAGIINCKNIQSEKPLSENTEGELLIQSVEYRADFTLIIGRDFNGRYVIGN